MRLINHCKTKFFLVIALLFNMFVHLNFAFAATINLSDETFLDLDWSATKTSTVSATFDAHQEPSGGNPGEYRFIQLRYTDNIHVVHFNNNLAYDPSLGAITSIEFNFDLIGDGTLYTMGLLQDGVIYEATNSSINAFPQGPSWASFTRTLVASDFRSQPDGLSNPDFSTAGSPIVFGFHNENTTGAPGALRIRTSGIDNYKIAIDALPPPSFGMELIVDNAKAKLNLKKSNRDKVIVEGEFWLALDSDDIAIGTNGEGFRVIDEEITVKFDGRPEFEQIFPAGSLVEDDLPNHFQHKVKDPAGPVDKLEIEYVPAEFHGKFEVKWKKRDLQGPPSPTVEDDIIASAPAATTPVLVPFDLDIGNDNGEEVGLNFELDKDKKNKRVYKFEYENEDEEE